jgi:hypothetical protein
MRKIGVIVLVLGMAAVIAEGAIITTVPGGAKKIQLYVNADGTAILQGVPANIAPADWVAVDGYEIWSASGRLIVGQAAKSMPPTPRIPGWAPGTLAANAAAAAAELYVDGSFGRMTTPTASLVAEMNNAGAAYFLADGSNSWHFASTAMPAGEQIMQAQTSLSDLTGYYSMPGHAGDKYLMLIVPEPATVGVLLVGGLALAIRRRR